MSADYAVTGQKQNQQINPTSSGFQDVWEVSYKVTAGPARGTVGTVTIPQEDHNADYVRQAIEDQISNLHQVASLGQ
jgi:hypothetical protein